MREVQLGYCARPGKVDGWGGFLWQVGKGGGVGVGGLVQSQSDHRAAYASSEVGSTPLSTR